MALGDWLSRAKKVLTGEALTQPPPPTRSPLGPVPPDSDAVDTFLEWHQRLWPAGNGDPGDHLEANEERLGVRLPALLRAIYLYTALRESSQMHLRHIEDVHIDRHDVLVFAREQQACWSWGVRVAHLADESPAVVTNQSGSWKAQGCSLEEFLHVFALINRPGEPPAIVQAGYDEAKLTGDWHQIAFGWLDGGVWSNGEAVLDDDGNLGAFDLQALRRSAKSLGVSNHEIAESQG